MILPNSPRLLNEQQEEMHVNEEPDSACTETTIDMFEMEHHIAYSTSYQVPVLYFRVNYSGK